MSANYERPKPIDTIHYRKDCIFRIHCGCGHFIIEPLGQFSAARGIPITTRIYKVIDRLKCTKCGGRPTAEVTRY